MQTARVDLRGNIPSVVIITAGKIHGVNILDKLIIEVGAIYVMDRGNLDFARLYKIRQTLAFFVTRTKINFSRKRLYSMPVDKSTGIQCDQIVVLKGHYAKSEKILSGWPSAWPARDKTEKIEQETAAGWAEGLWRCGSYITLEGQYSIRINDQWRICFTWQESDAYDVEITDYH